MKYLILTLMVFCLFISCEDEKEKSNKDLLTETWILVEESFSGGVITISFDYSGDISTTEIFKIESEDLIIYSNEFCSSGYTVEAVSINITNSTIEMIDENMTFDYTIDGNELILSAEEIDEGITYTISMAFEKYDGSIPPSEWSSTGDSYEPDDTLSAATAITVDADPQNHILCGGESDWFSFNAVSGTTYIMETFNDMGMDTYIDLYDATGYYVAEDDDGGNDMNAKLVWTCNATGSYNFNVHGFDYDIYEEGPYEISVTTGSGRILSFEPHINKQYVKTLRNQARFR